MLRAFLLDERIAFLMAGKLLRYTSLTSAEDFSPSLPRVIGKPSGDEKTLEWTIDQEMRYAGTTLHHGF